MAAKQQRASPAQGRLPLTREDRLAAIDAFEPSARQSMGPRAWRTVRGLLKAIEFCSSGGNDSVVRVEVLAAHLGVDVRTVQRARKAAEAAGLLRVVVREGTSNQWRVDWCRLATGSPAQLSPPAENCHPSERVATLSHPGGDVTSGEGRRHVTPPYKGSKDSKVPLSPRSTVDGVAVDQKRVDQKNQGGRKAPGLSTFDRKRRGGAAPQLIDDPQRVRQIAERIERRIGKCRSQRDWELAVKAAALGRVLGEDWLWDACEAVERVRIELRKENRRMERPWGYATRCWQSKAAAAGRSFEAELARLAIPPALAQYDGAAWRQTAETARMCQGGEL